MYPEAWHLPPVQDRVEFDVFAPAFVVCSRIDLFKLFVITFSNAVLVFWWQYEQEVFWSERISPRFLPVWDTESLAGFVRESIVSLLCINISVLLWQSVQ